MALNIGFYHPISNISWLSGVCTICTYALITKDICWTNLLSNLKACLYCELMDILLPQSLLKFVCLIFCSKITFSLLILLYSIFTEK